MFPSPKSRDSVVERVGRRLFALGELRVGYDGTATVLVAGTCAAVAKRNARDKENRSIGLAVAATGL